MITIPLQMDSKEPIYEQIYKQIRKEIIEGRIPCGTKLPSTRGLAANLLVSRSTIDMAYGQLVSEGYIEAVPQKGYFVSNLETLYEEGIEVFVEDEEEKIVRENSENCIDFSLSGVDMDYFPYHNWRKLMKESLIDDNKELFLSGNHQGDYELRKTICNYIHQSRGVNCKPSQILIGAGSDYMLLLLSHILGENQHVAMENPAYKQAYTIFDSVGYQTTFISLDEQGPMLEPIEQCGANLLYVTPSHQFPSGMVMSVNRRRNILSWSVKEPGRYIIEDDYDSEFRYYGKPIPSLQSQDPFERVIYMGTLSKVIAPGIRLSYMVLPEPLLQKYKKRCSFYFSTVSRIDQLVIGKFFEEGYFERHLNRMRKIYKNKHDLLIRELKGISMPIVIKGENAGLHIVVQFGAKTKQAMEIEKKIVDLSKQNHVIVYPISDYYLQEESRIPSLLIGFAKLKEDEIMKGISILKDVWSKSFTIENGNVIFDID
ncbi:MAG: PLP-dependent aminotransferase family protein [Lachnospiraceae bacterium]